MENGKLSPKIRKIISEGRCRLRNEERARRSLNGDAPRIRAFLNAVDSSEEIRELLDERESFFPIKIKFLMEETGSGRGFNYKGKPYWFYGLCLTRRGLEAYSSIENAQDSSEITIKVSSSLALEYVRKMSADYKKVAFDFEKGLERVLEA